MRASTPICGCLLSAAGVVIFPEGGGGEQPIPGLVDRPREAGQPAFEYAAFSFKDYPSTQTMKTAMPILAGIPG